MERVLKQLEAMLVTQDFIKFLGSKEVRISELCIIKIRNIDLL